MKKVISVLLALSLLFSVSMSMTVFAADDDNPKAPIITQWR